MKTEQQQITDFMIKAGQDCPERPVMPSVVVRELRYNLIREELSELSEAFCKNDLVEVADAIADLLVVTIGCAVACGIDIQPVWDEVHRSNMSKFIDGYKREDGKWVKGPSYSQQTLSL